MKPPLPPNWPRDLPITPRVASLDHLRRLEVIDDDSPVPGDTLCEVLPVGLNYDEASDEVWIAVRVAVMWPYSTLTTHLSGWALQDEVEKLPNLREALRQVPDDLSSLDRLTAWQSVFEPREHQRPSSRTRASVRPCDGESLLARWRSGGWPSMQTLAYLERALPSLAEPLASSVCVVGQLLLERGLGRQMRATLICILEDVVEHVGGWTDWFTEIDLEQPYPFDGPSMWNELFDDDDE